MVLLVRKKKERDVVRQNEKENENEFEIFLC